MSSVYRLRITPGLPLLVPMSYRVNGEPVAVDSPKAQIWTKRTGGTLVTNLTPYFEVDGTSLALSLTDTVTTSLADRVDQELWWDAYGIVAGKPVALVRPSPVIVRPRVTDTVSA